MAVFVLYSAIIPSAVFFSLRGLGWPDLWCRAVAFPLQIAAILYLPSFASGTRAYQLGLNKHRAETNAFFGYIFWLLLTPTAYCIEYFLLKLYPHLYGRNPELHPLFQALNRSPGWTDWSLVFFLAIVAAPIAEELLFRGIFQQWIARRPWGCDIGLLCAFGAAIFFNLDSIQSAWGLEDHSDRLRRIAEAVSPALFVLAMVPGYIFADRIAWTWLPYPGAGRTLYSTALFWAAFHSNIWPTPIPLFVLGLGLGYLAYRTQSLVGCIMLHALFNAVACLSDVISRVPQ